MPDPSIYAKIGRLSSIVMILPSSMAVGWVFGYYVIDHFAGTYPWGLIIGTLVGAGAGFYQIFKLLVQDEKSKGA